MEAVAIEAEDHAIHGEGGAGVFVGEGHGFTLCENHTMSIFFLTAGISDRSEMIGIEEWKFSWMKIRDGPRF